MRGSAVILVILVAVVSLWSQRTSRSRLSVNIECTESRQIDTLVGIKADSLRLSGFDKPLRSRKETFFVTNNGSFTVAELALTADYTDSKGRQLHHRHLRLKYTIEPGATVNIEVPTWDRQQSFYYHRSSKPKRVDQATPFHVAISVDTIFVYKP